MSETQWAQLVSRLNAGSTPCTLEYVGKDRQEPCPPNDEAKRFSNETKGKMAEATALLSEIETEMRNLLNDKAPSKDKRKSILDKIVSAKQQLQSNTPYIIDMLHERMETIVDEAKTEINAYAKYTLKSDAVDLVALPSPKDK